MLTRYAQEGSAAAPPRRRRRLPAGVWPWIASLLLCAWTPSAAIPQGSASSGHPSSADVEAAYLYNFGKFVRWPNAPAAGPMVICVAGADALSQEATKLVAGERIGSRALEVRAVMRADRTQGCSILFIGSVDQARLNDYLAAVAGKPVLTVSDASGFLDRGGMIQFVLDENHVRFAVNVANSGKSGLGLSSELLKVAVRVTGLSGKGGEQ